MKRLLRSLLLPGSLVLLMSVGFSQSSQNLVINGSFETYTQCPTNTSKIHYATPWTGPTTDNAAYLNACSTQWNVPYYAGVSSAYPAYLDAKEGVAYAEIIVYHTVFGQDYRSYAQVPLADTLFDGRCYYVEFYASNLQWVKYRCNNISACFTAYTLPTNLVLPGIIPNIQPHITNYGNPVLEDTVSWIKISGIYEAIGGEKYLTIGNFKNNSSTDTVNIYPPGSYPYTNGAKGTDIFIDAVSVFSINPNGILPWSYRDTTINKGDSVFIGNKTGGLNFHPNWFTENGIFIKTNAGITVSPTVTTKYIVQYTLCGVERTDTVKVTVPSETDVAIQKLKMISEELKIYPIPADRNLELKIDNEKFFQNFNRIAIFNNLGQKIREEELAFENKHFTINIAELPPGVYSFEIKNVRSETVKKRFVIAR